MRAVRLSWLIGGLCCGAFVAYACLDAGRLVQPRPPVSAVAGSAQFAYTLPDPVDNDHAVTPAATGETFESGVVYRVTASGPLTFQVNPDRLYYGPPQHLPGGLTMIGPAGFPPAVTNGARAFAVLAGRGPFGPFLTWQPNDAAAGTVEAKIQGPGELFLGRGPALPGGAGCISNPFPGQPCGCRAGLCQDQQVDYFVTGTQTVAVERLPPAVLNPDKTTVSPGETVTFHLEVSWSTDVQPTQSWQWVPEQGGGGTTTVSGCGVGDVTCKMAVRERGHARLDGILVESQFQVSAVSPTISVQLQTARVRIRALTGTFEVRPAETGGTSLLPLEVAVVDGNGTGLPGRSVALTVDATEGTAGHAHTGLKPTGSISPGAVTTGSDGTARATYLASSAAGPVHLSGTSEGATPAAEMISVDVPGLEPLPASDWYDLIGGLPEHPEHPDNHYGTADLVAALELLAVSFRDRYDARLEFNDMSLEQGGIFDLAQDWEPPHLEHRTGNNCDLRISTRSDAQLRFVRRRWELMGGDVLIESAPPHYHLTY